MSNAKSLLNKQNNRIAVIGDGAVTGGMMAYDLRSHEQCWVFAIEDDCRFD
jgi:deoxyxylulose-5-phosphate synthase